MLDTTQAAELTTAVVIHSNIETACIGRINTRVHYDIWLNEALVEIPLATVCFGLPALGAN